MKNKLITKLPYLLCLLVASCGNYEMTTPITPSQEISKMSGVPAVSGKPDLRTPARIGMVTTQRTNSLDFSKATDKLKTEGSIKSFQPVDPFISQGEYYQLNDVLSKRAKLIQDTKFLGLDVLLVCDQQTQTDSSPSLLGVLTLGILDAGMRKQDTQLTVLCMDARTGYVYGAMGRQEDGHTANLSVLWSDDLGDSDRSHLVQTTRREAVEEFPKFWKQIVDQYGK